MSEHEEALRRIIDRILSGGAWSEADCVPLVREAFVLGWNAGAKAQREADAKEWKSRSGLYNADAVYRLIFDVPLVTLDDAKDSQ